MYVIEITSGEMIGYYDEDDIAECRRCHAALEYKWSSTAQSGYIRCPKCGIKTGTSTSGLEGVLPVWNGIMDDRWPESDPKRTVGNADE